MEYAEDSFLDMFMEDRLMGGSDIEADVFPDGMEDEWLEDPALFEDEDLDWLVEAEDDFLEV